jgi:hypothetical protein
MRKSNHNKTTQRASSKYYPLNSAIFIEDSNEGEQMIIMNERSSGVALYQIGMLIQTKSNRAKSFAEDVKTGGK